MPELTRRDPVRTRTFVPRRSGILHADVDYFAGRRRRHAASPRPPLCRTLATGPGVTRFRASVAACGALVLLTVRAPDVGHARENPDGLASDPLALMTALGVMNGEDRSRLDAGSAVVAVVPARGRDLAVFGIARTEASPARLITWTREIEQLRSGRYMRAMGRFSTPPRIEDLAALSLDDGDLKDLRACRAFQCGVKLSGAEITGIRVAASAAGPRWKEAVQTAFRQTVLARLEDYLQNGLVAAPPYEDRKQPVTPAAEFREIASRIGVEPFYIGPAVPYFESFPAGATAGVESVLYWSKETLGSGKPIVSITHAAIFRNDDAPMAVAVAERQVYASHYLTGSLAFTLVAGGPTTSPRYLVYVRRTRTDAFDGPFGRFVRGMVERRIRTDAPGVLDGLRRKLEADPPSGSASE